MEYQMSEKEIRWCDNYLKSRYVGCVKDKYEDGCMLYFKDINNFVQNAGRYSDLEVFKVDGDGSYEILFDTKGTFINQIWPELSWDYRSSINVQANINYIASRLQDSIQEEGLYPKPLPRIEKYLEINHGKEVVLQNREYLESVKVEQMKLEQEIEQSDIGMQMNM